MPVLSIVIPAFNEAEFIGALLERVVAVPTESLGYSKEIIVVDDGSKDDTGKIAGGFLGVKVLAQVPNQGKGRAVQRGIRESTGNYVLVQDADLEYNPADYMQLLAALAPASTAYTAAARSVSADHPALLSFPAAIANSALVPGWPDRS